MMPLWKIKSGDFAGWRSGDRLFNADGQNVGCFRDDVAYSLHGDYLGEMYDDDRIGKRTMRMQSRGSAMMGHVGIALMRQVGRVGLAVAGWSDPDF